MPEGSGLIAEDGLVDLLDRLLGAGVVAAGDVTLSVAGIDLVYLNLRALLASVGTVGGASSQVRPLGPVEATGRRSQGRPDHPPPPAALERPTRERRRRDQPDGSALGALERFARGPVPGTGAGSRFDTDPEDVQRGLARLVLTLVDLLRRLMERQAIRRVESATLDEEDVERLGRTFLLLEQRMEELKETFGLRDEDLGLGIGLGVEDLG